MTGEQRWHNPPNESGKGHPAGGALALVFCSLLVAAVWLVLLPGRTNRPEFRSEQGRLQAQGIDPSAMYYTELDMMDDVIRQNDRFRRRHPSALWVP